MGLQPWKRPGKKEADEASRSEALQECYQHMENLQKCAPDGIAFYGIWPFYEIWGKCRIQKKDLEKCLGQQNEAVSEEAKRKYKLRAKGEKGPAKP